MATITIDVWADVVCPWCYLGERRLQAALEALREAEAGVQVEARWRPFQLQPQMPAEGLPWTDFAERKFGGLGRAEEAYAHLKAASADDDLAFHFNRIASAPNTVDAHRLILYAGSEGRLWDMAEALFKAYFTDGRNLNNEAHLLKAAEAVGLDPEPTRAFLQSDAGRAAVTQSQSIADQAGIRGVPLYILDNRYALSGAQPIATLLQALQAIAHENAA